MKKWLKVLLIVLSFLILYAGIMVFAYDYLYEYPIGILDTIERADEKRYYSIARTEKIDEDTLLYFTKSKNGVGLDAHVGTLDTSAPEKLANFFAKSTSSYYIPVNTISFGRTEDGMTYLFGTTSDENTVKVIVTFIKGESETVELEMNYAKKCYYYLNFDASLAQYPCTIIGYNTEEGLTFQYTGNPITEGVYTPN